MSELSIKYCNLFILCNHHQKVKFQYNDTKILEKFFFSTNTLLKVITSAIAKGSTKNANFAQAKALAIADCQGEIADQYIVSKCAVVPVA